MTIEYRRYSRPGGNTGSVPNCRYAEVHTQDDYGLKIAKLMDDEGSTEGQTPGHVPQASACGIAHLDVIGVAVDIAHDVLTGQAALGQLFIGQSAEKFDLTHPRLRGADRHQKVKNAVEHTVQTSGDTVALWDVYDSCHLKIPKFR